MNTNKWHQASLILGKPRVKKTKQNKTKTNKLTTDIYEGTFVTPRNVDVHIINNMNIIKENVMVTNSLS